MKKLSEVFEYVIKSPILVGVIMFKDLFDIFNKVIFKTVATMNIDYYDFAIKLFMSIMLVALFRQYYSMKAEQGQTRKEQEKAKKEQLLTKLFSQVMFEKTYKLDEIITTERNIIIDDIKLSFSKKVHQQFRNELTISEVDKLVNEFFEYAITELDGII